MINPTEQFGGGWIQRLRAEAKRKPRTALIFLSLLVILCGIWGRMLVGGGVSLPAAASAMFDKTGLTPQVDAILATIPGIHEPRTLSEWAQQPSGPVTRNLFAIPFDGYPPDPANPMPQTRESAKSGPSEADQTRERQIVVEKVRTEAAKLSLQGIVLGATPKALVNGTMVGVGQAVNETGFKIIRIDAKFVLIERDGVQVELKMK